MRRILATVLVTAAIVVPATRALSASSGPAPVERHTVRSGETLWNIARASDPGADPRKMVDLLIELNDLSSAFIAPGQVLILPSR